MGDLKLTSASGSVTLSPENVAGTTTITLPSSTATLLTTNGDGSSLTGYEGTAVASTGEAGGTKFLREDGDGTCSWQTAGSTSATDLTSGTLNSARLPTGTVVQAKSVGYTSSSAVSVASPSGSADLMSTTMTVQANSKVMMWFDSHQTELSQTNCNPNMYFEIDGSQVSTDTNHYFYQNGGRTVISKIFMSNALTAGSHTFKVIGKAFNGTVTYNFQGNNGGIFMLQEIKG